MKKVYKLAAVLFSALLLSLCAATYILYQDYQAFLSAPMDVAQSPVTISVEKGASFTSLAYSLNRQGIKTNTRYLRWYARSQALANRIKAGKYTFQDPPTPVSFVQRLVGGQVDLHQLTIVEGWTFRQMLTALEDHEYIQHTLAGLEYSDIMARLGKDEGHPEGVFLPDTYHFPENTTDVEFLKRAMDTMSNFLRPEWDKREEDLPLKSPYEALILASIIEKETGAAHERAEIAGVFSRRLKKGMKLQTDPTVIYGLGEQFDGNLRRRDLTSDTPYNTYTRTGLPPTPIALPGRDAIRAALHPAPGNTLYFVAMGDGTHYFSATLEEHNRAVAKYQLGR